MEKECWGNELKFQSEAMSLRSCGVPGMNHRRKRTHCSPGEARKLPEDGGCQWKVVALEVGYKMIP
jgi:hypothetical protein